MRSVVTSTPSNIGINKWCVRVYRCMACHLPLRSKDQSKTVCSNQECRDKFESIKKAKISESEDAKSDCVKVID